MGLIHRSISDDEWCPLPMMSSRCTLQSYGVTVSRVYFPAVRSLDDLYIQWYKKPINETYKKLLRLMNENGNIQI